MSRRGNCYDNAAMESWNSTLKSELGERFLSPADAKAKLFDYIEVFYNQARMHSSMDYASPAEFARRSEAFELIDPEEIAADTEAVALATPPVVTSMSVIRSARLIVTSRLGLSVRTPTRCV